MPKREELCLLYAVGYSLREIAERCGVAHTTIKRRLLEGGMTLRPRGRFHGTGMPRLVAPPVSLSGVCNPEH